MSKLKDYVDNQLDIDQEYYEIFNRRIPLGKMFCPFHSNTDTPAAKKYGNHIQCFGACKKRFTVYDLLKRFNKEKLDLIASSIVLETQEVKYKQVNKNFKIDRDLPIKKVIDSILTHYEYGSKDNTNV